MFKCLPIKAANNIRRVKCSLVLLFLSNVCYNFLAIASGQYQLIKADYIG